MLGVHKSISLPQSTEYAKEMAKWEAYPSQWGPAGRPYQFREFPKMMVKADYVQGKGTQVAEEQIANSAEEEVKLRAKGFYFGNGEAFAAVELQQREFGTLAAKREWEIQHGRISDKATSEVRAAEAEHGARHLPDVPAGPVKRRTRGPNKPKTQPTA